MRDLPGNDHKLQSVTITPYQLNFGHGNRACPGRFFAVYEIKVMLIHLLRYYEMRLPSEDGKTPQRPKNFIATKVGNSPNSTAVVEVRRREKPLLSSAGRD